LLYLHRLSFMPDSSRAHLHGFPCPRCLPAIGPSHAAADSRGSRPPAPDNWRSSAASHKLPRQRTLKAFVFRQGSTTTRFLAIPALRSSPTIHRMKP
jgi:hypothetical protein